MNWVFDSRRTHEVLCGNSRFYLESESTNNTYQHSDSEWIPFPCSLSPPSGKDPFLVQLIVDSELDEGDLFLSLKSSINFGNNSRRLVINTIYSMVTTPSSIESFSDTTKLMSYSLLSRRMSNVFGSEFRSCVSTRSVPSNTWLDFAAFDFFKGSVEKSYLGAFFTR